MPRGAAVAKRHSGPQNGVFGMNEQPYWTRKRYCVPGSRPVSFTLCRAFGRPEPSTVIQVSPSSEY